MLFYFYLKKIIQPDVFKFFSKKLFQPDAHKPYTTISKFCFILVFYIVYPSPNALIKFKLKAFEYAEQKLAFFFWRTTNAQDINRKMNLSIWDKDMLYHKPK